MSKRLQPLLSRMTAGRIFHLTTLAALAAAGQGPPALADCATPIEVDFGISGGPLPPAGTNVILATVAGGLVQGAEVEIAVTAPPGTDAGDWGLVVFTPILNDLGGNAAFVISGADLGWSGSGSFSAQFPTADFDGLLPTGLAFWESEIRPAGVPFAGQAFSAARVTLSVRPGIPGELSGDGFVGLDDLLIVLGAFGQNAGGDTDCDGDTDLDDLLAVLGNFGACEPLIC